MKILVTSGGTKVPIDSVRDITNMSEGTFGSKIAKEFLEKEHEVIFFHSKKSKTPFKLNCDVTIGDIESHLLNLVDLSKSYKRHKDRYKECGYRNYEDYSYGLWDLLDKEKPDILVLAAAVSDYGIEDRLEGKIRSKGDMTIDLHPLPKLISEVKKRYPDIFLVGFKLLVGSTPDELHHEVEKSVKNNNCDIVIGNDLLDLKTGNHKLHIGIKNKQDILLMDNTDLPKTLVNLILDNK